MVAGLEEISDGELRIGDAGQRFLHALIERRTNHGQRHEPQLAEPRLATDLAGDGDHYAARVTSTAFAGKNRIQQHKLVYAALGGEMGGALAFGVLAPFAAALAAQGTIAGVVFDSLITNAPVANALNALGKSETARNVRLRLIQAFESHLREVPEDARARMRYLINALAKAEVSVANFYYVRRAYIAAIQRAQIVVRDFQTSPAAEDALTPSHFEDVRAFVKGYRAAGSALTVLRTSAPAIPAWRKLIFPKHSTISRENQVPLNPVRCNWLRSKTPCRAISWSPDSLIARIAPA